MATVRRTATERWKAQVYLDGRFRSRTFDSRKLAEVWARDLEVQRDRGEVAAAPSSLTLADWWAEVAPKRRALLARATIERNEGHWRRHLQPALGSKRLIALKRSDITSWVAQARADGVGAPTVTSCVRLLSAILQVAVEDGMLRANPAARITPPKHLPRAKRWISPAEVDAVVAELEEPYALLVSLAASTGLRWGEIAGLTAGSVDPFGRFVDVRSVLTRTGPRDYPKNSSSARTVPVPSDLRPALLHALVGRGRSALIFAGTHGGGLSDRNTNQRYLLPACRRAGVEPFSFHALRHAYCSWLVAGGVPLFEVSRLVGHSSTRMLEQTYAHLAPGAGDRAEAALLAAREGSARHSSGIVSA